MPVLQIIIGSTRPVRSGQPVAEWLASVARADGRFDVEVVDLKEVGLPLLDEPHHPRLQQYTHEHTRQWSSVISRGDAYIFVHPEYNHGYNAALKNALDYLFLEWRGKPASFAGYGGVSGGLRATQMLKQVAHSLGLHIASNAVVIPFVGTMISDGRFTPTAEITASASATLDDLDALVRVFQSVG